MLSDQLQRAKTKTLDHIASLSDIVSHLEDLEGLMLEMRDQQIGVEVGTILRAYQSCV
jgi:hypothetical protein